MAAALEFINETLNELVLKVFSGADYVSKIALETGKSIPVVHRQLETLVKAKLLVRERKGKRVVYSINWSRIADATNSMLIADYKTVIGQIHHPELRVMSVHQFQKATNEFLDNEHIRKLLRRFFSRSISKVATRQTFMESMQQFLDVFGMMSERERKLFEKKIGATRDVKLFLRYCEAQYRRRLELDNRQQLLTEIRAQLWPYKPFSEQAEYLKRTRAQFARKRNY